MVELKLALVCGAGGFIGSPRRQDTTMAALAKFMASLAGLLKISPIQFGGSTAGNITMGMSCFEGIL